MTATGPAHEPDDVHRHLELGFVSVLEGGRPCGAGLLADPTHVVTCAHVVNTALGRDVRAVDRPEATIAVAFPYAGRAGRQGRVVVWRPVGAAGGDVAVLELVEPAPPEAAPVRLVAAATLVDHAFFVWGFPQGGAGEMLAEGVLSRRRGDDLVQMQAGDGQPVRAGYSGAPVWDEVLRGVVGIVTSSDPDATTRTAYLLPTDVIAGAWPDLPVEAVEGDGPEARRSEAPRVVGERISAAVESWRDRDELRRKLRELLLGGGRIVCVTGRRGIGKSAVVAKVLAEFEQPDPARSPLDDLDGLVYLSTRTQSGVLSLATVFDAVASLGDDETAARLRRRWDNAKAAALPALWEAVRRKRAVVVLDNLDDLQDAESGRLQSADLLQFLESVCHTPYPQRVVTTSQRSLDLPVELLPNVHEERLDEGLGPEDALALLRAMQGASPGLAAATDDQLVQAADRLHGVPRGLELLAREVNRDPFFLDDLLASDTAPGPLLAELVSRSFAGLDGVGRRVVALLALAAVPLAEPDMARMLAGTAEPGDVRRSVRALVATRQLGFDPVARHVRLHPLDADYVQHVLLADEPGTQVDLDLRLADWYAAARRPESTWRAVADVTPLRREFDHRWRAGQHEAAMAVLAAAARFLARKGEAPSLLAAAAAADGVGAGPRCRFFAEWCRYNAEFFEGSLARAEAALRACRALAAEAGMPERVPSLDVDLGALLRHQEDPAGAVAMLQPLAASADLDPDARAYALFEVGLSLCYLSRWAEAEEAAAALAAFAAGTAVPTGVYDALPEAERDDVLALARLGSGDYDGAIAAADEAIRLYLDSPVQDNAGYPYNVKGIVALHRDDLAGAEAAFRSGAALGADYGVDRLEGICTTNLAWTLLRAGRRDEAREAAERAADRLAANAVGAAATGRALAGLLAGGPAAADAPTVRGALEAATAASRGNADLYTPPEAVVAALVADLTGE